MHTIKITPLTGGATRTIEVFKVDGGDKLLCEGWYYWFREAYKLPSEPVGGFASEIVATQHALDSISLSRQREHAIDSIVKAAHQRGRCAILLLPKEAA